MIIGIPWYGTYGVAIWTEPFAADMTCHQAWLQAVEVNLWQTIPWKFKAAKLWWFLKRRDRQEWLVYYYYKWMKPPFV